MVCQLRASWERPHVWQRTAPQGKAALSRGAALCSRNSVCLLCCLLVLTIGGATEASEDSVCSGEDGDVFAGAGSGARGGEGKKVLVLGSGGLVGRSVVQWLEARNYTVLHVRNRRHLDLRRPGALSVFDGEEVSFCFFLACEVGGAKFIESSARNTQAGIIDSNLRIYQEVLPYLERRGIPFVFTSSYLHGTENSYGVVKRLGEQWVRNLGGLGKTLRLWNVYGAETLGPKSHVLSDWAAQCAAGGRARSRTDGREERQFVHVEDTAAALGTAMLLFGPLPSSRPPYPLPSLGTTTLLCLPRCAAPPRTGGCAGARGRGATRDARAAGGGQARAAGAGERRVVGRVGGDAGGGAGAGGGGGARGAVRGVLRRDRGGAPRAPRAAPRGPVARCLGAARLTRRGLRAPPPRVPPARLRRSRRAAPARCTRPGGQPRRVSGATPHRCHGWRAGRSARAPRQAERRATPASDKRPFIFLTGLGLFSLQAARVAFSIKTQARPGLPGPAQPGRHHLSALPLFLTRYLDALPPFPLLAKAPRRPLGGRGLSAPRLLRLLHRSVWALEPFSGDESPERVVASRSAPPSLSLSLSL